MRRLISARASRAPRQWWGPAPNARWSRLFGRSRIRRSGSLNCAGSRLAAPSIRSRRELAGISAPASVTWRTVRRGIKVAGGSSRSTSSMKSGSSSRPGLDLAAHRVVGKPEDRGAQRGAGGAGGADPEQRDQADGDVVLVAVLFDQPWIKGDAGHKRLDHGASGRHLGARRSRLGSDLGADLWKACRRRARATVRLRARREGSRALAPHRSGARRRGGEQSAGRFFGIGSSASDSVGGEHPRQQAASHEVRLAVGSQQR